MSDNKGLEIKKSNAAGYDLFYDGERLLEYICYYPNDDGEDFHKFETTETFYDSSMLRQIADKLDELNGEKG